jgi:hypothetical protein
MKKSGKKWCTEKCGQCGDAHSGYSGKLDSKGIEYVVCGNTHKRMNVMVQTTLHQLMYHTKWRQEDVGSTPSQG